MYMYIISVRFYISFHKTIYEGQEGTVHQLSGSLHKWLMDMHRLAMKAYKITMKLLLMYWKLKYSTSYTVRQKEGKLEISKALWRFFVEGLIGPIGMICQVM